MPSTQVRLVSLEIVSGPTKIETIAVGCKIRELGRLRLTYGSGRTLPDPEASGRGLVRVIDESGEDYLFPATLFEVIELPTSLRRKLALG